MFKKNSLPMGMLTMVLIIGVALAGVGYALWSETLTISGTVQTGEVDVEFSVHPWEECVDVNGQQECPEPVEKEDAANCTVEWAGPDNDSNGDDGPDQLLVTVEGMYPSWHCKVQFDVTSTGTVPVHVWRPVPSGDIPVWVATDFEECYPDGTQLHTGDSTGFCTMDIHFTNEQAPPENSGPHTFGWTIQATQWNEDPPPVVGDPVTYSHDYINAIYKGFGDRYRSFQNTGGEENYLGVDDLGNPANRVAEDFAWSTSNDIQFIYDKDNDMLTSIVDTGSQVITLEYPNVGTELAARANGCTIGQVDFMYLQLRGSSSASPVTFSDVYLDGFTLPDFVTPAGGDLLWSISNFNFSDSFTLSGTLELPGPISGTSQEANKLDLLVACAP